MSLSRAPFQVDEDSSVQSLTHLAAPHRVALLLGQGRPSGAGQTWVSPGPALWVSEAGSFSRHIMLVMMHWPCPLLALPKAENVTHNSWQKSHLPGCWELTHSATHAAAKARRLLSLLACPYAFCWKQQIMRQILVNGHALIDISCVVIGRGESIWLLTFKEKRGLDFSGLF